MQFLNDLLTWKNGTLKNVELSLLNRFKKKVIIREQMLGISYMPFLVSNILFGYENETLNVIYMLLFDFL